MEENRFDVIVIGGGISGLTAAYTIKKKRADAKVIVIEGKDRVGGRTLTVPLVGANGADRWDLGGQWVGACQTHVIQLLKELGLETYPQYTSGQKLQQLGGTKVTSYSSDIPSLSFWALIDLYWHMAMTDRYQSQINVADPFSHPRAKEWDAMSIGAFLNKTLYTQGAHDAVEAACRVVFGCEPSQVSLLFYLIYIRMAGGLEKLLETKQGAAQELRIKGGAQMISLKLMESLGKNAVKLADPVASVHQTDKAVEVTTETGWKGSASFVVVATPPKAMEHVDFSPPLSSFRRDLMKCMPMGSLTKVILTYETAFWRDAGLSGEIVSNGGDSVLSNCPRGPLCLSYDACTENGSPALVAFLGGNLAVTYGAITAKERQNAVLEHLSTFFGPQVCTFLDYAEKDWNLEHLSHGSPVSYLSPGGMGLYAITVRRPEGRLHFAGTETATIWSGYMSGAIQAGEASAMAVLHRLYPNCLSQTELEEIRPFIADTNEGKNENGGGSVFSLLKKDVEGCSDFYWWFLTTTLGLGLLAGSVYLVQKVVNKDNIESWW
ncbi:amine oxidase [Plakobranchus ocellatus]|uniref:Amine oxidase n=1 Tax=Plakobranchus ocellatus TaxID=259542 RepID=A0AAV3Y8A4_9GAST|nr:amine oxidase [Plakobranchus ocellatus]